MQIQLEKTLDVEIVERELAQLWTESARDPDADTEAAVLRARVANLLVFISSETALDDVHRMLRELTAIHPSRVLLMLGAREAADHDIEMFVESICQNRQARRETAKLRRNHFESYGKVCRRTSQRGVAVARARFSNVSLVARRSARLQQSPQHAIARH